MCPQSQYLKQRFSRVTCPGVLVSKGLGGGEEACCDQPLGVLWVSAPGKAAAPASTLPGKYVTNEGSWNLLFSEGDSGTSPTTLLGTQKAKNPCLQLQCCCMPPHREVFDWTSSGCPEGGISSAEHLPCARRQHGNVRSVKGKAGLQRHSSSGNRRHLLRYADVLTPVTPLCFPVVHLHTTTERTYYTSS